MSKIVVVTGAGTGVGRRVAEVLSKEGMVVYLIGSCLLYTSPSPRD